MVKAIFFDIDGTLREFDGGGICGSTKRALAEARKAGIRLFIATGRHYLEIEEENLLEDLEFDGYVTLNGQYCFLKDPGKEAQRVVYKNPICQEQVKQILDLIEEDPFPCLFMEAHKMDINYADERVERVQRGIGTAIPPVADIQRAARHEIFQIVPYMDKKRIAELVGKLPRCDASLWHDGDAVDLMPKGSSKVTGIRNILFHLGISREETAAIGDGRNDITMLRFAGTGIAMGNAFPETKEAADYVTGDIKEDGLAQAVRWLMELFPFRTSSK